MNLQANGVDPTGENLPDELFYREEDISIELRRERDGWRVDAYHEGCGASTQPFDDFTPAFCEFLRLANQHDTREKPDGVFA